MLQALVAEVCRILPDPGRRTGTTVWLFLSSASELRADRVLLESATVNDPSVGVRVRCLDGDLVGIDLALRAADAWHEQPDGLLAVVTDAGRFATVAQHFGQRPGREQPWLLHLHERPPGGRGARGGAGKGQGTAITRRLRLPLDEPSSVRLWNEWDGPAWALRRLAAKADAKAVTWSLRAEAHGHRSDPYQQALLYSGVSLEELEKVDNLVSDLWRLDWGAPVEAARIRTEINRRLGVDAPEAAAVVDALLVAQLLRWHDAERLEIPSPWREGLLLPMRRVVLRLARRPGQRYPVERLIQQHRRRFIGRTGAEPLDPRLRKVEHESRVDAWRWVRYALVEQLQTVEERQDWRPGKATWALTSSKFAFDTVETAEHIRQRLGSPVAAGRLEAMLEQEGIARPSRWLRSLRDVGLIERQADRWVLSPAGGGLRLP